jgi:hypothetical protein
MSHEKTVQDGWNLYVLREARTLESWAKEQKQLKRKEASGKENKKQRQIMPPVPVLQPLPAPCPVPPLAKTLFPSSKENATTLLLLASMKPPVISRPVVKPKRKQQKLHLVKSCKAFSNQRKSRFTPKLPVVHELKNKIPKKNDVLFGKSVATLLDFLTQARTKQTARMSSGGSRPLQMLAENEEGNEGDEGDEGDEEEQGPTDGKESIKESQQVPQQESQQEPQEPQQESQQEPQKGLEADEKKESSSKRQKLTVEGNFLNIVEDVHTSFRLGLLDSCKPGRDDIVADIARGATHLIQKMRDDIVCQTMKALSKTDDESTNESTVLLTLQNNMCFGSGFRQDVQYIIPWKKVKNTLIGQRFGSEKFIYLGYDMSFPPKASEEDRQISSCIKTLTEDADVLYDAEMDDGAGEELIRKLNSQACVAPTRFIVCRGFC